jgi:hypothetical protein
LCRARHGLALLDLTHLLVAGGKEYWERELYKLG